MCIVVWKQTDSLGNGMGTHPYPTTRDNFDTVPRRCWALSNVVETRISAELG